MKKLGLIIYSHKILEPMPHKPNPTQTAAWKKLTQHFDETKHITLQRLFEEDPNRFEHFSACFEQILLDYSKNHITQKTLDLFFEFAKQMNLKANIEDMFAGKTINETEKRAVLHTALRNSTQREIVVDGKNIVPEIKAVLRQMEAFSNAVISGKWKGYTNKRIKDVVNIGIGGSDLGPVMATEALKHYKSAKINTHFVSNVDATHLVETLKNLNPETTLFLIASKTFTTQETMTNAQSARHWLVDYAKNDLCVKKHFVAISTNTAEVEKFGIDTQNMFQFWDWVGGRYSLWSAIGLSICCSVGYKNFKDLLKGAQAMDKHFRTQKMTHNLPIILAVIGVWYTSFFQHETEAILPYDQYLHRFAAYLQQANMESNGKSIDKNGNKINYQTGPIIWGEPGTNGQHAFYQLIHQGTKTIPADFLAPAISQNPIGEHHQILLANFFAQTEALMKGKNQQTVVDELTKKQLTQAEIDFLTPFKVFEGNRPTNSILYKQLTPRTLGSLIALYEHKIFVQGVLWNVFSFDQWGVELGKQLANNILPELFDDQPISSHDSSTNGLINAYKQMRKP